MKNIHGFIRRSVRNCYLIQRKCEVVGVNPKSKLIVFLILLTLGLTQQTKAQFTFDLGMGYGPFKNDEAQYSILTNSLADQSPVKSIIKLDMPSSTRGVSFGIGFGYPFSSHKSVSYGMFVDAFYQRSGKISALNAAGGLKVEFKVSDNVLIGFRGGVCFIPVWGKVGQVGERSGDVYLRAPDGYDYPIGSEISVNSSAFGGMTYGELRYYTSQKVYILFGGGYQFGLSAKDWSYEITDKNDKNKKTDLPKDGLDSLPPKIEFGGSFIRIGIGLLIEE
ncbi:MAG: hypothetical protein C4517_13345 [Stygiobacter sp.]|nr:MAG: hypothetical protein C4517_13345 [Stygiobacter sp.]